MKIEIFERKVIFRIARGLFMFLAIVGLLGFIASFFFFGYTVSPTLKESAPREPKEPAPPTVTAEEVQKLMNDAGRSSDRGRRGIPRQDGGEPFANDPMAARVKVLVEKLHADCFPGDGFPWYAQVKNECVQRDYWTGRCTRYKEMMVEPGVINALKDALGALSSLDKITTLETLIAVLPAVPVGEAPKAEGEAQAANKENVAEEAQAAADENSGGEAPDAGQNAAKQYEKRMIALGALLNIAKGVRPVSKEVFDLVQALVKGGNWPLPVVLTELKIITPEEMAKTDEKNKDTQTKKAPDVPLAVTFARLYPTSPVSALAKPELETLFLSLNYMVLAETQPETLAAFLLNFKTLSASLHESVRARSMADVWAMVRNDNPAFVAAAMDSLTKLFASSMKPEDQTSFIDYFGRVWSKKSNELKSDYLSQKAEHDRKLDLIDLNYNKIKEQKNQWRKYGFLAVVSTLFLIALVGIILAALAIERNTRMLEQLLQRMSGAEPVPTAVPAIKSHAAAPEVKATPASLAKEEPYREAPEKTETSTPIVPSSPFVAIPAPKAESPMNEDPPAPMAQPPVEPSAPPAPPEVNNDVAAREHYSNGNRLAKQGAKLEAIEELNRALALIPNFPQPYRSLGVIYASMGQREEAAQNYRRYVELAPNAPDAEQIRKMLGM